jgi:ribosomal protein RSM22 (predicted rRNA methylase)
MATNAQRAAYLQVRMPATFAANLRVLREVRLRLAQPLSSSGDPAAIRSTNASDSPATQMPSADSLQPAADIRSLLDLGAGPGTAMWAAAEVFPALERITLVERDAAFAETGQRIAQHSSHPAVRSATWARQDLASDLHLDPHDVVVLSYAAGEAGDKQRAGLISRALGLAAVALVIVEPGTPRGFAHVLQAREQLIAARATLIAPCPHEVACPMAVAGDWCHFAQRLERTGAHRRSKGATLGYEDEKFSYVAAGALISRPAARIVRHPLKHSGHVQLTLCAAEGLKSRVITRSERLLYRAARHAQWGDEWNELE